MHAKSDDVIKPATASVYEYGNIYTVIHYTLRSRRHNLQLYITSTSLIDKNFLPRMLHMDSY